MLLEFLVENVKLGAAGPLLADHEHPIGDGGLQGPNELGAERVTGSAPAPSNISRGNGIEARPAG